MNGADYMECLSAGIFTEGDDDFSIYSRLTPRSWQLPSIILWLNRIRCGYQWQWFTHESAREKITNDCGFA